MNTYFGSTLTDAQNAVTAANQQSLQEDVARRNFIAMLQDAAIRKRQAEDNAAFNREQLSLRSRGMDMDNQNAQMAQLLQALGVLNQFQTGDFNRDFQNRKLDQEGSLMRDQLANPLDIAKLTAGREDARVAAERLRQQGAASELQANIDAEASDHNARATAKATQYNALISMLDKASKERAGNTGMPWNRHPDNQAYEKLFNEGLQNIMGQMLQDKGADSISFDPASKRFEPILKRISQTQQPQSNRVQAQQFNIPATGGFSEAASGASPSPGISSLIQQISSPGRTVTRNPGSQNDAIHAKVADLANQYMRAGLPRQQAIAKAMNELSVPITPRQNYPLPALNPSSWIYDNGKYSAPID